MNKKVFVVLSVLILLANGSYAQVRRPLKMAKQVTEAVTGGVPSAFSQSAPVSFVGANMLGRKIRSAQFAQTNPVFISSTNLFNRVHENHGINHLSLPTRMQLAAKFSQLDMAVKTSSYRNITYLGALWNMDPVIDAAVLAEPNVNSMVDLLDVQRFMQTHGNVFPQLFSVENDGILRVGIGLETPEGNDAFRAVLAILVKQSKGLISPVIVEQLAALRIASRNQLNIEKAEKLLKDWRLANNDPQGAPKLPTDMEGFSLRNNPEALWLATEIRILQLIPRIELPEMLKNVSVITK